MNQSIRPVYCVAAIVLLLSPMLVAGQDAVTQPKKEVVPPASEVKHEGKPVSFWMEKKLDYSKNLLEGIATADFDQITQNAQTMKSLNRIEWFIRSRTPGYRTQLSHFEDSLDQMIRQAKKENLEGVTLSFHQMTLSCVRCHDQLREAK